MDAKKSLAATEEQSALRYVFEERPYGGRLRLTDTTTLIMLAPHANTAAGLGKGSLNKNGLRGHPCVAREEVTLISFADGKSNEAGEPLVFRYEDQKGKVQEERYPAGREFFTVADNGTAGYYHVLENTSDRPIVLVVKTTPRSNCTLLRSFPMALV